MLSCRYVFGLLLLFGTMTFTCLQSVMNVAIVAMVNDEVWAKNREKTSDECPGPSQPPVTHSNTSRSSAGGEFYWDPYTQGLILGANSYGTLFTHFLGGFLAARYGGKWILGGGILVQSLFSCLTPISAYSGVTSLFVVRFCFGLAEGVIVPASIALIARWAPKNERSTFIGLSIGGFFLGYGFISVITGYISSRECLGGWPTAFYLTGGIGCFWFLLWAFLVESSPEYHPRISKDELFFIKDCQETCRRSPKVPWKSIILSCPFWSIVVLSFCYSWLISTFNAGMPLYLTSVLRVPIEYNGLIIGLVYPANIVGSLLGGLLADCLRKRSSLEITTIRKIFTTIGFLCGTFFFICIPQLDCNLQQVFLAMFLTKLLFTLNSGGSSVVLVDMAPQFAGVLNGFVSTLTGSTGFLSPLVTGKLINDDVSKDRWFLVFLTSAIIAIAGLFAFLFLGSAEVQAWAVQKSQTPEKRSLENSLLIEKKGKLYDSTTNLPF